MTDLVTRLKWLATQLDAPNNCGGSLVREVIAVLESWSSFTCGDHDVVYLAPECPMCHEEHLEKLSKLQGFAEYNPEG